MTVCVDRPEPEPVEEEKAPAEAEGERRPSSDEVDRQGMTNGDQEAAVQKEAGKSPLLLAVDFSSSSLSSPPSHICHRHCWGHLSASNAGYVMSITHISLSWVGNVLLSSVGDVMHIKVVCHLPSHSINVFSSSVCVAVS